MTPTTAKQMILIAARTAAPVFAVNNWGYSVTTGHGHTPDAAEIALLLRQLVDSVVAKDVDLDADGYGEIHARSGRFTVSRFVYLEDDDSVSISLELA